jgi:hypothetical protein
MDAPLIALTQQCNGDLRQLLFAFFSFLNRRTDFYLVPHPDDDGPEMGFAEGDAEKLLLAAFRQFPLRRIPKGAGRKQGGSAGAAPAAPPTSGKRDKSTAVKSTQEATGQTPTPMYEKLNEDTTAPIDKIPSKDKAAVDSAVENLPSNMIGVKYNEKGLQIPVGNGGSTPQYKWTQTLEEATVLVAIANSLRGRDLDVSVTPSRLSVKSKAPLPGEDAPQSFLEGELVEKICADESSWTLEGGVMIVTLDKLHKKFWSTVLVGDEKIDTELVDSRRNIADYDEATQGQIRKIIFDQTQYHKGLPSSDEILGKEKFTTTTDDSDIPDLPPGVEYIDKKKLDSVEKEKKASK